MSGISVSGWKIVCFKMALCRRLCFTNSSIISNAKFSTTCFVSNKWRRDQGLEPEPRQYGPLTNLPDYSFVDGRPTIFSQRKIAKLNYQRDICKRIAELSHELDVGLQQYHERKEQERKRREEILKNKLKPKGAKLLMKANESSELQS